MSKDARAGQRHLVDRLFSILDTFTPGEPRLTVSDISRRTLLPVATVHRLANQLANEGALERGDDGRYGIGIRMLEIARMEERALRLRSVALPRMLRLQEATGSMVLLCVLSGKDVVVLEHVAASANNGFPPRQGAATTAAGRLLLAHRTACRATVPAVRSGQPVIGASGLTFGGTQADGEPFSVAAPVEDGSETVVAALSTVGLAPGHERADVVREVKRAASEISAVLAERANRHPVG
jgi:DNA-binding IclR family transcriptional regulator